MQGLHAGVLLLVAVILGVSSGAVTRSNYPALEDHEKCSRNVTQTHISYVCDPHQIITEQEALELDGLAEDICRLTSCSCTECSSTCPGFHTSLALIDSFNIPFDRLPSADAKELAKSWATTLRNGQWKHGVCSSDDLVIILSKHDKQVYTSTGSKVRQVLPDDCVHQIYLEAKKYFEKCLFGQGLDYMLNQYKETIRSGKCSKPTVDLESSASLCDFKTTGSGSQKKSDEDGDSDLIIILVGLICGAAVLLSLCLCCYARLYRKCCFAPSTPMYTVTKNPQEEAGVQPTQASSVKKEEEPYVPPVYIPEKPAVLVQGPFPSRSSPPKKSAPKKTSSSYSKPSYSRPSYGGSHYHDYDHDYGCSHSSGGGGGGGSWGGGGGGDSGGGGGGDWD